MGHGWGTAGAQQIMFDWGALPDDVRREVLRNCDRETINKLALTSKANRDLVARAIAVVQHDPDHPIAATTGATIFDLVISRDENADAVLDGIRLENVRDVVLRKATSEDIAWLAARPMTRCKRVCMFLVYEENASSTRIEPGAFDKWTSLRSLVISHCQPANVPLPARLVIPAIPPQLHTFIVKLDSLLNDLYEVPVRELALEFLELQCYSPSMRIVQGMSRLHTLIIKPVVPVLVPRFVFDDGPAIAHPLKALRNLRLPASCVPYIPMLLGDDAGRERLDALVIDVEGDALVCVDSLPPTRRLAVVINPRQVLSHVRLQCASVDSFVRWIQEVDFKYFSPIIPWDEALVVVPRDCRGCFPLLPYDTHGPHGQPVRLVQILQDQDLRATYHSFCKLIDWKEMSQDPNSVVYSALVPAPV